MQRLQSQSQRFVITVINFRIDFSICNRQFRGKIGLISHQTTHPRTWTEPRRDKTNKMTVRPAKTQISLGICPVWSESSLCPHWVAQDPGFLHADSEDSDQTGRMPRLIWVFAGRTLILLVLSCHGSVTVNTWQRLSWLFSLLSDEHHYNLVNNFGWPNEFAVSSACMIKQ